MKANIRLKSYLVSILVKKKINQNNPRQWRQKLVVKTLQLQVHNIIKTSNIMMRKSIIPQKLMINIY